MRKFKFFALAFAALSFAACSDDAIDGQGGNNASLEDASPAYLTIAFSANAGSSSRASDDSNTGDNDGTIEDSEHENAGTADETKVVTALVVVVPADDTGEGTGFAKKYTTFSSYDSNEDASDTNAEPADDDVLVVINDNTQTYSTDAPISVLATATGIEYKVLVVVNPVEALTSNTAYSNINTGITDLTTARSLYNDIITGNYSYTLTGATEDGTTYATATSQLGNSTSGFMMANRAECKQTVTTANTPENPAEFELDVERVLSKITFRPKNMSTIMTTPTTAPDYVYKVTSTIGTAVKAEVVEAVYDDGTGTAESPNYVLTNFNRATDLNGNGVFALYNENDELLGVYGDSGNDVEEGQEHAGEDIFVRLTPKTESDYESNSTNAYVAEKINNHEGNFTLADEAASISLVVDPDQSAGTTKEFWVKLEGYSLINLSKNVNYVRHTIPVGGAVESPFGTLTSMNYYLWTPYWDDKNAVQFDANGDFIGTPTVGNWFYNTLAAVSTQSESLTVGSTGVNFAGQTYFTAMPGTSDGPENPGTVTGSGDKQHTSNLSDIGYLLGYCFENSVETQQQRHGLTTGIGFVATMWENEECTDALDRLYLYAGNNFENIQQIVDAYAGLISDEIKALAAKEAAGTDFTTEDLETMVAQGIRRYEGNICYYYSSEIKHYDNNEPDNMGIMEFAIMRNNIYSLSVTDINDIGDPFIDPTPGIENESEEAALVVRANIVPWIVRYNDIEFN